MKAIVIDKIRKEYYGMEYIEVKKYEFEGKNKTEIMSKVYSNRNYFDGKIEVEFVEE